MFKKQGSTGKQKQNPTKAAALRDGCLSQHPGFPQLMMKAIQESEVNSSTQEEDRGRFV